MQWYIKKHNHNPATRMFDDFRHDFSSIMNRFFDEGENLFDRAQGFSPKVDIREDEKQIHIEAELPGIDEKDLNLEVKHNTLILTGEKKHEKEDKEKNYHCIERSYGSFRRELHLPDTALTEQIKASYKKGVLTISIPKNEQKAPKKLKIDKEK